MAVRDGYFWPVTTAMPVVFRVLTWARCGEFDGIKYCLL